MPKKTPRKTRRLPALTDKRFKRSAPDMGTEERWQHSGRVYEFTEIAGVLAARATEEHVLDRLKMLNLIDENEHEAGLKLQEDFVDAHLSARLTSSYSGQRRDGGVGEFERNAAQEAAYRRWRRAVDALQISVQDCVMSVACAGMYPAPIQLASVKTGLAQLARHYGLKK